MIEQSLTTLTIECGEERLSEVECTENTYIPRVGEIVRLRDRQSFDDYVLPGEAQRYEVTEVDTVNTLSSGEYGSDQLEQEITVTAEVMEENNE